jgi:sugar O-acyltransferase (sialic acid O-acetyltransferase NeuD family)
MSYMQTEQRVILVGAGGHCKALIDLLLETPYEPVGILDPFVEMGTLVNGVPVVGTDADAPSFLAHGIENALIASTMPCGLRKRLVREYLDQGFFIPTIISEQAIVSQSASIEQGAVVMSGANIGAQAHLGGYCTVNVSAVVAHGVSVGEYSNVAPNATLLGSSNVGAGTLIGAGSVVLACKSIGDACIVGAGSVVLQDVPDDTTVVGNPARALQKRRTR